MKEIWKRLEEDTNYEISNLGRIRNIKTHFAKYRYYWRMC